MLITLLEGIWKPVRANYSTRGMLGTIQNANFSIGEMLGFTEDLNYSFGEMLATSQS